MGAHDKDIIREYSRNFAEQYITIFPAKLREKLAVMIIKSVWGDDKDTKQHVKGIPSKAIMMILKKAVAKTLDQATSLSEAERIADDVVVRFCKEEKTVTMPTKARSGYVMDQAGYGEDEDKPVSRKKLKALTKSTKKVIDKDIRPTVRGELRADEDGQYFTDGKIGWYQTCEHIDKVTCKEAFKGKFRYKGRDQLVVYCDRSTKKCTCK